VKRFTDTDKWLDPWFADLPPLSKLVWLYICDKCDHAGVIDISERIVSAMTGCDQGDVEGHLAELGRRVEKLPNGKWFVPGFVEFQYGALSEKSNLHKSVFRDIEKNNLNHRFKASSSHQVAITKATSKGKGKGKVRVKYSEEFERFWKLYPKRNGKKVGKADCWDWWQGNSVGHEDMARIIPWLLMDNRNRKAAIDAGKFYESLPDPCRWLKGRWWTEPIEPIKIEPTAPQKTKLYPILGKTCSRDGCKMPAVYKSAKGNYDHYYCLEHSPQSVREQYG
jgi:hypothetical protein